MIVGCPTEIKSQEHRVGLVPSSAKELVEHGHKVLIQSGAGAGINFTDDIYREAGAEICDTADEIFARSDMIIKVKEPQPEEYTKLREGQILFTYLHLAAEPEQTKGLMDSGAVCIAYETVTGPGGKGLPLLAPMSEVAGRLSPLVGSYNLLKHLGGTGRLISGVPGVLPARVVVIGGGVAGFSAARVAAGMGAQVTILEKNHDRLRFLDDFFRGQVSVCYSSQSYLEYVLKECDLVIGAVLIPGASAPKLVSRDMIKTMIPGTVMVDIAIDQGGCFETSRPTTHNDPTYVVDDVVHYCVTNMPGAVPLTSALALNHAVLPYALQLADKGWKEALAADANLRAGLNVCQGKVTHRSVAESLGLTYTQPETLAA